MTLNDDLTGTCAELLLLHASGSPDARAAADAVDAAHRDPRWWQRASPVHVTVSVLLVHDDDVLLTLHPKFGRWMQLGGHLEPDDRSLAGAALREATEESGQRHLADPVLLGAGRFTNVQCRPGDPSTHLDIRYLVHANSRRIQMSDESLALAWWPLAALPTPHDGDLLLLASQARSTRSH